MITADQIQLIPCPFCGGRNVSVIERKRHSGGKHEKVTYAVLCDYHRGGCGANGGRRATELEAKIVWNHRILMKEVKNDG